MFFSYIHHSSSQPPSVPLVGDRLRPALLWLFKPYAKHIIALSGDAYRHSHEILARIYRYRNCFDSHQLLVRSTPQIFFGNLLAIAGNCFRQVREEMRGYIEPAMSNILQVRKTQCKFGGLAQILWDYTTLIFLESQQVAIKPINNYSGKGGHVDA